MEKIRAFIAIDLDPKVVRELDELAGRLKSRLAAVPIRWVAIKNIHLTLKFLGEILPAQVKDLQQVLSEETKKIELFEIEARGLGAYPSLNRPRVVWVGVQAPTTLFTLQKQIDQRSALLGFPSENRPFSAHLTLGRVDQKASRADHNRIEDTIQAEPDNSLGTSSVDAIHLYKSILQPQGAQYTRLYSAALKSI